VVFFVKDKKVNDSVLVVNAQPPTPTTVPAMYQPQRMRPTFKAGLKAADLMSCTHGHNCKANTTDGQQQQKTKHRWAVDGQMNERIVTAISLLL
jgi:hypothetical protein